MGLNLNESAKIEKLNCKVNIVGSETATIAEEIEAKESEDLFSA